MKKVLQVAGQRPGKVCLTVTTTPKTRIMFFEKDGTAACNLGYASVTDLTDSLAVVIAGSRTATQVGFGLNTGYWIDLSTDNGIAERHIRFAVLPVYTTRLKETSSPTPFGLIQLNVPVLARSIQKFNHGSKMKCRIEANNRYRYKTPIIRCNCGGRVRFTDPDGIEYSEGQLKQRRP